MAQQAISSTPLRSAVGLAFSGLLHQQAPN
jgi:hypothetical protein